MIESQEEEMEGEVIRNECLEDHIESQPDVEHSEQFCNDKRGKLPINILF